MVLSDSKMDENKIVIYQTEDGQTQIDVRLENETVWLTQAQMAELFQKDQSVIARHINNALKEGELEENSNMHFLHNTQYKYRPTKIYDLDTIICVGYRVHSKRGAAFRIWARKIIKDYLVKGYAVNQRIHSEQIGELRQLVGMLGRTLQNQPVISTDETTTTTSDSPSIRPQKKSLSTLLTKMRWKPSVACERNLVAQLSLVTRKMILSRAVLAKSIRLLEAMNSIQVSRRKPLCYFILSLRTTLSVMVTNALLPRCSFGS